MELAKTAKKLTDLEQKMIAHP